MLAGLKTVGVYVDCIVSDWFLCEMTNYSKSFRLERNGTVYGGKTPWCSVKSSDQKKQVKKSSLSNFPSRLQQTIYPLLFYRNRSLYMRQ